MLSCEEGKEIALCDGVLALVWEFDVELVVRRLFANDSSCPCDQGADCFVSVCVGGVVYGVVSCVSSGLCCDYGVPVEWNCPRGF